MNIFNEVKEFSINDLSCALKSKEFTSKELTQAYLERIEQQNGDTNAYITICADLALKSAQNADQILKNTENPHILTGIPMAIKDNICTKGIKTTAASKMLKNHVPAYDASVWQRLQGSGAVLLGKTNMDEFGMGSTTENSAFGAVKNPLDKTRSAGGSSGGSAAAVADGMAVYALGSDTGGSIRLPAAFCNLVGLCPTYGGVSRYGLISYASSLDRIAPIAKSAKDCQTVFDAIKGKDFNDPTSNVPYGNKKRAQNSLDGIKIAMISQFLDTKMTPEVKNALIFAAKKLETLGAVVDIVDVSRIEHCVSAYYIISCAESCSNLARYDSVRYGTRASIGKSDSFNDLIERARSCGFGEEVRRRILLGTYMLSDENREKYYKNAVKYKNHITNKLDSVLDRYDIILSPVYADLPPRLGSFAKDPVSFYENDIFCLPFSLSGLPSLCLPSGQVCDGLPIGIQLSTKRFCEDLLFDTAKIYEKEVRK